MSRIEIQQLTKQYLNRRVHPRSGDDPAIKPGDTFDVISALDLNFNNGEMVCILGPSGCGKSTMLRIIAGFDVPSSGQVLIDGRKVREPGTDHIFVFQQNGLLPWMTVWDNIGLGLRHMKDKTEKESTITEFIEMVELDGFEHHYPHQLSGGMQRRAELARALAVNPNLLIMDEPFSGLDFLTHMKMREEVVNMHEYLRKTTLVVTHDIDDALIMGDRIVVLSSSPATVRLDCHLDYDRPRDFEKLPELSQLRSEIFFMLGVNYAV
ncbi:MAG: ABC transporter ATP-binding protein [Desulfobacteraceae bacterium]|nr:ABC transporter ATP-binding protein [Desulfobacteraceae bacterium]